MNTKRFTTLGTRPRREQGTTFLEEEHECLALLRQLLVRCGEPPSTVSFALSEVTELIQEGGATIGFWVGEFTYKPSDKATRTILTVQTNDASPESSAYLNDLLAAYDSMDKWTDESRRILGYSS